MSADQGDTHHSEDAPLLGGNSPNAGIDLYEDGYVDPVYQAKARILNRSIQDIGMGKYQVLVTHADTSAIACSLATCIHGSGVSSW